jgi:hypothetical protein
MSGKEIDMSHPIQFIKCPQGDKRPSYLKPIAPWHVAQFINELNILDVAIEQAYQLGLECRLRSLVADQQAVIADLLNGVIE